MASIGWYYLHVNGQLIFKQDLDGTVADLRESDLVVNFWPVDPAKRGDAWQILVESLCLGGNRERINELATKWKCTDLDAMNYAKYVGFNLYKYEDMYIAQQFNFRNPMESPMGSGVTALDAMAELCKELGYQANKTWGAHFSDLVVVEPK